MIGDMPGDGMEHLQMLYPEFVDRAMRAQEPVTRTKEIGEHRTTYEAAMYFPDSEVVWRCYIDADEHPDYDSKPSVHFSKCYPNSSASVMQNWTSMATGRLGGPQKLVPWEQMFTVFNAALGLYNRSLQTESDR